MIPAGQPAVLPFGRTVALHSLGWLCAANLVGVWLGVVVVGIAAGMVALPPEPPVAARPFAEQLAANGLIAIVSLSPGVVGGNEVHITVTPPGGSITPIASVAARVSLPSAAVPNAPVTLVKEGVNHYSGSVTFPRSGDWTLEVVIQVSATEAALLSTTVPIP